MPDTQDSNAIGKEMLLSLAEKSIQSLMLERKEGRTQISL